ncbi:MAG: hypothetical protein EOO27_27105, partial [Comamonadaceae bacterium]
MLALKADQNAIADMATQTFVLDKGYATTAYVNNWTNYALTDYALSSTVNSGLALKQNVSDMSSYQQTIVAGSGLTKTGVTLSVDVSQPQITSVGTLTALSCSGVLSVTNATASSSTTTGALKITGGV